MYWLKSVKSNQIVQNKEEADFDKTDKSGPEDVPQKVGQNTTPNLGIPVPP